MARLASLNCTVMKYFCLGLILSIMPANTWAQTYETENAVLVLTGAASLEDLDEDTMDVFRHYSSHPLHINVLSDKKLMSSGLFSRYQAASLLDYRKRNGNVLSVMELSLVDGFDEKQAEALSAFVSFDARSLSETSSAGISSDILYRTAGKCQNDESLWNYGAKIRIGDESSWTFSFAAKSSYGKIKWPPETASGSVGIFGRNGRWSAVVGDYNTRFGQGLLVWSGFSLSGAQSAASFSKHPAGLSSAWTMSPANVHRGVSADVSIGRTVVSCFWGIRSVSGVNATRYTVNGQIGLTALDAGRASADWRWSLGKTDFFGEFAMDFVNKAPAGVVGMTFNPEYRTRFSALARYYDKSFDGKYSGGFRSSTKTSDECGLALGFDCKSLTVTADAAFHPSKGTSQHKALVKYSPQVTERLLLSLKASSRFRPEDSFRWRNEIRSGATYTIIEGLSVTGCLDFCRCREWSWLAFGEGMYRKDTAPVSLSASARMTAFVVDDWDDRIYMYERDIPGAFSVPAYYGRGYSVSGVVSCKWNRLSVHARFLTVEYPGMTERKPGKAEFKLQLVWNFQFHSRFDVG